MRAEAPGTQSRAMDTARTKPLNNHTSLAACVRGGAFQKGMGGGDYQGDSQMLQVLADNCERKPNTKATGFLF